MRIQLIVAISALTLTACATQDRDFKQIQIEYVKTSQYVVVTDELLGMTNYRKEKHLHHIRDNVAKEHFMLAATIWAEARGEGYEGMRAVGYVIANRMKNNFRTDGTIEGTVKWPKQFSCWNKQDPNRVKMTEEYLENAKGTELYQWETAKQIAADIMRNGTRNDITNSSLFYHAEYVSPDWASNDNKSVVIGQHIFYQKATRKVS